MIKSAGARSIREIDSENNFNLLYITINPAISTGLIRTKKEIDIVRVTNLAVYDLNLGTINYVFDANDNQRILNIFYEKDYNDAHHQMNFNEHSSNIINNKNIEKRDASNHLFLIREGRKKEDYEFWQFSKKGDSKKLIKNFHETTIWKLDVFNKKILFIKKHPNKVEIESFDW